MKNKKHTLIMVVLVTICVILCAGLFVKSMKQNDAINDYNAIDYSTTGITYKNIFFQCPDSWEELKLTDADYMYLFDSEEDVPPWSFGTNIHVQLLTDSESIDLYNNDYKSAKKGNKHFKLTKGKTTHGIDYKKVVAIGVEEDKADQYIISYAFMVNDEYYSFLMMSDREISKENEQKLFNAVNSVEFKKE